MNKNYRGLWIPKEIFELGLTPTEEKILSGLLALSKDKPCDASNSYLCDSYNIKGKATVSRAIKRLSELGHIKVEYIDKGQYTIRYITVDKISIGLINCQWGVDEMSRGLDEMSTQDNIVNNIDNNISISESEPETIETPETEQEEKQDRSGDFGKVRHICAEMYEVLRKKQPGIYGFDKMTPEELKKLREIKKKITTQQKAINTAMKNPYARVTDDDIIKYWNNFIKFIPPYMLEKSRLNPQYILNNFDKLVKEVRAELLKRKTKGIETIN